MDISGAKLVRLGRYDGLDIARPDATVTFEEYHQAVEMQKKGTAEKVDVTDRPAQIGDVVTIDFVGSKDGVEFAGGSGQDYPLELGSGAFIPGFEEQLVGTPAGGYVEVNVTFPEDYDAPDLAGQLAVFKCSVKKIQELKTQDLTPEMEDEIMKYLTETKAQNVENEYDDMLTDAIIADSEFEISDEAIAREAADLVKEWKMLMSQRGMDPDTYISMTGKTEADMAESFKAQAGVRLKTRMVLEAIAKEQNIMAAINEINDYIQDVATSFNMDVEEVKKRFTSENLREIEAEIRTRKALEFIKLHVSLTKAPDTPTVIRSLD